jgi:hypothetical protein
VNKTDKMIIEKWYKLDENAVPAEYVLQSIIPSAAMEPFLNQIDKISYESMEENMIGLSGYLEDSLEKSKNKIEANFKETYIKELSAGKAIWNEEEPILKTIVRNAVTEAMQYGDISTENGRKYFQSSELLYSINNKLNTKIS